MVQIITNNSGGGGSGGAGDMLKCVYDPNNVCSDAFDYCNFTNTPDLSCYQEKSCLVCDLTGADNSHYPSAKAVSDALQCAGAGDMLKSVYDPNNCNADAFDYCNFSNTPTIPTDNCQLANGCGYTTCTGTVVASDLNAYATTASLCTVATSGKYCDLSGAPTIPTDNCQLANGCNYATCCYVNDSINSVTAYYITKNANGDQFATYAELAAATTFYSGGVVRTPTKNDYTIVLADENHDNATTRYIYNSGWEYQYTVNETALTQAQLDALNSGITATKVSCYDAIPVITDNCQICNGCGYTTCTGTLSTCSDVISALGYTPYNSTNPNGYTTCTGTLQSCDIACINGCCLTNGGDVCIQGGSEMELLTQCCYNDLPDTKLTDGVYRFIYQ